jgi:hypothetical protein
MASELTFRRTLKDLSGFAYVKEQERVQTQTDLNYVTALCKEMLASATFHPEAIKHLAHRQHYAFAANELQEASLCTPTIFEALISPAVPAVAAYRFARLFHAIPDYEEERPLTIPELQLLKTEAADCALAALGIIDWKIATTRTRAVFALRALIAEVRS